MLFAYIAGANRASAIGQGTIAMTTPVEVSEKELVAMAAYGAIASSIPASFKRRGRPNAKRMLSATLMILMSLLLAS